MSSFLFFLFIAVMVYFSLSSLYFSGIDKSKNNEIKFIHAYQIPKSIIEKFQVHYPQLTNAEIQKVIEGLKIYFVCCLLINKYSYMPSKAVDTLWHEFILNTIEYRDFCDKAFGEFLHHIPSNYKTSYEKTQAGLAVIWQFCCAREGIDSFTAYKLPLLFVIDSELNIADGRHYDLERAAKDWGIAPVVHKSNYDSSGGGDGGGCGGGGCGGGGCGGGCGGGG